MTKRDSTILADSLDRASFFSALNAYFDCTAGAVLAHGGQVSRFIGDAVLAIFPIRSGCATGSAAQAALEAAKRAVSTLAEVNRERTLTHRTPLRCGIALHIGDVLFGNIGVSERLEFSVIGSAVNEVARLEDLTKSLGCEILASAPLVDAAPGRWKQLGAHSLRGVAEPLAIYTPLDDAPVV